MKFSIITPSFNQGRFIADCIESVRAQKESSDEPISLEIEHIIIDAVSTDQTLEILKNYPHLDWVSEADSGMSDGINKGFLKATGDWVMWLNCDDYFEPNALAKAANYICKHPEADIVHGDCIFVREDKTIMRRKYDSPVDEWDLLYVGCVIPSTSCFISRRIIEAGHLLDLKYKNTMDLEYYLRLMRQGYRFLYLPEALACFRWHNESTTQKHWQRMLDESRQCQLAHICERNFPRFIAKPWIFLPIKIIFRIRRIIKRLIQHGRLY